MAYDTDIECGEELANDISSGALTEADLTESGKRKLALYRDTQFLGLKLSVDTPPED
jgi:hypothetical protein